MVDHLPAKRGCSQKTVTSYRDALALLIDFLGRGSRHAVALDDIDALSVKAFLDHPESDRDNGVSTRNQRQAALNSFFSLVRARKPVFYSKITQEMGVPRKHSTPPVMEYLTVAEVEALFSSIDDSTKRAEGEGHDRLPLRGGGARWGAPGFSPLPVEARRCLYVKPHGKGGKTRNAPITMGYEKLIGAYTSSFGMGRGGTGPVREQIRPAPHVEGRSLMSWKRTCALLPRGCPASAKGG